MRRIARISQPSAWQCAASRQSVVPLATQCAAAGAAPLSAARTATRTASANTLRLYSQKPSLPQSLSGSITPASTQQSAQDDISLEELESLDVAAGELSVLEGVFRPPPSRHAAPSADRVTDPSYSPATSAAGLTTIGGLENWWQRRENWAKSGDFAGFKAKKKIQDPRVIETAVRRAVMETIVLKDAGREGELVTTWPVGSEEELARVLALNVQCDTSGVATLVGDSGAVAEDLSWDVQETREAERPASDSVPMCSTEEATAYLKSWDPTWTRYSLHDSTVKFAVSQRSLLTKCRMISSR